MKNLLSAFIIITLFSLVACSGGSSDSTSTTPSNTNTITNPTNNAATTASSGNVQHYTCPNACAGSGGSTKGTCPVCGTEYVHNAAFHNQNNTTTTTPSTTIDLSNPNNPNPDKPAATTPSTTPSTITPLDQPPSTAEPAQNAAGVWHYTCPDGCEGGGNKGENCSKCGKALVHNGAYHN